MAMLQWPLFLKHTLLIPLWHLGAQPTFCLSSLYYHNFPAVLGPPGLLNPGGFLFADELPLLAASPE